MEWQAFRQFMVDQRRHLVDNAVPRSTVSRRSTVFRTSPTLARQKKGSKSSTADTSLRSPWASLLLSSSVSDRLEVSGAVQKLSGASHTWRGGSWQSRYLTLNRKKGCLTYVAKEADAESPKNKVTEIPLASYSSAIATPDYKRGTERKKCACREACGACMWLMHAPD